MTATSPTAIGRVRHVLGSTVTVELDSSMAGVSPIWHGRLISVGQIGSLVRIPQGPVSLLASVTLVGIAELNNPATPLLTPQQGDRWLQVQLIGEVDALGIFRRGVSTYPGLDDPVHFATPADLTAAHPGSDATHVGIGRLSANSDVEVALDLAPFVTRHSAVVGSTGSGKTSGVATLLQAIASGGWPGANVVVVDPHGEYAAALRGTASVRSVLSDGDEGLRVPFWVLPAGELLSLLTGIETRTVVDRFAELVTQRRQEFAQVADWLDIAPDAITADTPVPFNLRQVWYDLDFADRETIATTPGGAPCLRSPGDAASLQPATFDPYSQGSGAPYKGGSYSYYRPAPERLRLRLSDPRYGFFLGSPDPDDADPLLAEAVNWLGAGSPISVLDFSGVPGDIADVAIGIVLDTVFELSVRSQDGDDVGRHRPTLVVLEEAHRYLSEGRSTALARTAVNRIAREGRKYGVGVCLVSQRPSELPETALSQCGTIVALRLTNARDQGAVRAALPDSLAGLSATLPSLSTGEALISGEAVRVPTRVLLRRPSPPPQGADAVLDAWRNAPTGRPTVQGALDRWRGRR